MQDKLELLVLANGATSHAQRWVDYFVDRGDGVRLASLEKGVRTRAVEHHVPSLAPIGALRYPLALPFVRRLVAARVPDVVVGHFVPNYGFLASLLGFRPYVVVVWGSDVLLNASRSRFHLWRARRTLEGADLVLSDARMLTDAIEALGIQPRRIETFTFGIDTDVFRPFAGERPEPPILLSIRQLHPLYHVDLFLRALPELERRTDRPFQARIVGQGPERARLIRLAGELGVSDRVTFLEGRLSDDALLTELQRASIYVSTSRSDTTSVSLLEAMACGVAPVVTDIAGNREWIQDGENGVLVPTDDPESLGAALATLLEDRARRETFAERNLRLVRAQGDWARNMERTRRLLVDLVTAERRRSECVSS